MLQIVVEVKKDGREGNGGKRKDLRRVSKE